MRRDDDAQHFAKDRDADLYANAGQESDQHRARKKVGEETELAQIDAEDRLLKLRPSQGEGEAAEPAEAPAAVVPR